MSGTRQDNVNDNSRRMPVNIGKYYQLKKSSLFLLLQFTIAVLLSKFHTFHYAYLMNTYPVKAAKGWRKRIDLTQTPKLHFKGNQEQAIVLWDAENFGCRLLQ